MPTSAIRNWKARWIATFLVAMVVIAGCAGIMPYEPRNNREEGPEKGLFTGSEGEFVIFRVEEPERSDEGKRSVDEATEMESLVKGADKDTAPSPDVFELTLAALEKALAEVLESVQTLGPSTAGQAAEPSAESMASAAAALDQEVAKRIRDAAEMGDVNQLTAMADELKSQSDSFAPFCDKVIQLAGDFDFDGIINVVNEVEKTQC